MRKSMVFFIALAVLAACGAAWGADSNTLTVRAHVKGTCKFSTATSTLDFGQLDPSIPAPVNMSTTTGFWCTKGLTTQIALAADFSVNAVGTTRRMKDSTGLEFIPYSLTLLPDSGTNQGPDIPRTLTISGTVLAADYIGKSEGDYSDTVVLTFTP